MGIMRTAKKYFFIYVVSFSPQLVSAFEYNLWYKDELGVYYDSIQTSDSHPVFISLYKTSAGTGNVVISRAGGSCGVDGWVGFKIDNNAYQAQYKCISLADKTAYESFSISDYKAVNYFYTQLKNGITIVLQDDIKVWASNFSHPSNGSGGFELQW